MRKTYSTARSRKKAARSARARRLSKARWARPQHREMDADTARWWALQSARGRIEREGHTYRGDGTTTAWAVRRSISGTTRQLDIIADGRLIKTAGKRRVNRILKQKPPPP